MSRLVVDDRSIRFPTLFKGYWHWNREILFVQCCLHIFIVDFDFDIDQVPVRKFVGFQAGQTHGVEEFMLSAGEQARIAVDAGDQSTAVTRYRESGK